MIKPIATQGLDDPFLKDALIGFNTELRLNPFTYGDFKFFEVKFTNTGTVTQAHNLGFVPSDVIQTSAKGSGTVVFNYSSFDKDNISLTIGGTVTESNPFTIRYLVGKFKV